MQVVKRDWVFLAVIVVVLGALLVSSMQKKPKVLPHDEIHRRFYDVMHQGGERVELEKGCATCHGIQQMPLPKAHPPKEQCLLCHKLIQATQ